jgi:uncharacterized membrane protein YgcG
MDFFNQQFNRQPPQGPQSLWSQSLRARYGFAAGIIVGILIGWFFHGVVSLILRLGIIALLLIPVIILGVMFLRSRRPRSDEQRPGPTVFTIGNVNELFRQQQRPYEPPPPAVTPREPVIELNEAEYDLEEFKKRLERDS